MEPQILTDRIRQLLRESGLTQQALAKAADMDPTALSKVLSGKRRLSTLELALIAEVTGVSVTDLLASDEREAVQVSARAQPDTSPAVVQALRRVDDLLDVDVLLRDLGLPALPNHFPLEIRQDNPVRQADELAREVRGLAGAGDADIEDLADFCEQKLGIDVAVEPLPAGLDGLSVSRGNYRLALVSSAIPATRQRYTLAHEVGHLAAGDTHGDTNGITIDEDLYGRHSREETRANSFAAAFLMPETSLRRSLGHAGPTELSIGAMLGQFRVSLDALAFRLHNVELVNAAGRDRVRQMSARRLVLMTGRAEEYQRQLQSIGARRLPTGLLQRAMKAYNSGGISVRILARLTGVPENVLLKQLQPLPPMTEEEMASTDTELVL
ncbi:ImmA/IrrE family metallo-endopeptidase [Frankia sp. Cj3]|uniref:helix-turn-helix domain-containing protein n=1 Tax=Frankia sp. Cj3 TaxID=2880976 RepID=UPI001EF6355E|nr:XRE family transcriptional regulator [Frankia sp. Cj3]